MNTFEFSGYVLDELVKNQKSLHLDDILNNIPSSPPVDDPEYPLTSIKDKGTVG